MKRWRNAPSRSSTTVKAETVWGKAIDSGTGSTTPASRSCRAKDDENREDAFGRLPSSGGPEVSQNRCGDDVSDVVSDDVSDVYFPKLFLQVIADFAGSE
jgi:hypothetical protein